MDSIQNNNNILREIAYGLTRNRWNEYGAHLWDLLPPPSQQPVFNKSLGETIFLSRVFLALENKFKKHAFFEIKSI